MDYPLTISEWHALVKGLKSAYVSQNLLATDEAVKIWYSLLRDIPYKILNAATMSWIATEHFPPTIADLRQRALRMTQPERHEWSEAWLMVRTAIQVYGFYRKEEALDSMPPEVRAAAERIGWNELCNMPLDQEQIYRAQFRDIYNTISNRLAEHQALPGRVQAMIGEIQEGLMQERQIPVKAAEPVEEVIGSREWPSGQSPVERLKGELDGKIDPTR